ncbi:MAG TPA: ROK family protein [Nevskiaceae bacterium]|nr:ROK family protein [Nevskiaceae bacterium]
MRTAELLPPGVVMDIGGTNYRSAVWQDGVLGPTTVIDTPSDPADFFASLDEVVARAQQDQGAQWATVMAPCPVKRQPDGTYVMGPAPNIAGMNGEHNLNEETRIKKGVTVIVDNDVQGLAAASAAKYGNDYPDTESFSAIGAGTGIGGGQVDRDPRNRGLFHPNPARLEIGHDPATDDIAGPTFEDLYSGRGLEERFGMPGEELSAPEIWREVGAGLAKLVLRMGLYPGGGLVTIGGAVGSRRAADYGPALRSELDRFRKSDNPMRHLLPEVRIVPKEQEKNFALYGGAVLARSAMVRGAA